MKSSPTRSGLQEDGSLVIDDRERMESYERYLELRRRVEEQKRERAADPDAQEPAISRHH